MTAPTPMVRENVIAFCAGRKASGKTTLLYRYFVARSERIISLDFMGEVKERNPNAIEVVGLAELKRTLHGLVATDVRRWHIAAVFDEYNAAELPELFKLLCPPYSPGKESLSRALGGLALECSECDVILPNGGAAIEARNMVKRGRHNLLSLYLATQRPQECSRLCTSQADFVISFAMHEPRELQYFAKMSERYAAVLHRLPPFTSAWYHTPSGQVEVRGANGERLQSFSLRGAQLTFDDKEE